MRCLVADAVTFVRTDEQSMLADTVRDFLVSTVDLDDVRELSLTDNAIHTEAWEGLKEMGLVGLHIPEQFGGAGFSFVETAIVFEELGRRVVPVPLLSSLLASVAILEAGSHDQKANLLPLIASGDEIATLAAHETAHDDSDVQCRAELTDSGWVVSGTKRFVVDGPNADTFVVSANTGEGVGLFVVRRSDEGVTMTPQSSLDATRPLGELALDEVVVDNDLYLGNAPHPEAVSTALNHGVVALAQEQVGGAQRCLEMSVEYAKTRFQFGRAIGSFQAVKHMCADMLVSVEHARSVAWHAAR